MFEGRYLFDFYAPSLRLAVEISDEDQRRDTASARLRDAFLAARRVTALRFTAQAVERSPTAALERIRAAIEALNSDGDAKRRP